MAEPTDKQTSIDIPRGQVVWECPSCARRYLTNQPPTICPYCLSPVQRSSQPQPSKVKEPTAPHSANSEQLSVPFLDQSADK